MAGGRETERESERACVCVCACVRARGLGRVGVVKTLVSRPGIRVSRHNAGALIDRARARARDQPAPKATRLFFNVRELKKLINDVMRPLGWPGRKRVAPQRAGLRRALRKTAHIY